MAFRYPSAGSYTFDTQNGADCDAFLWTDPLAADRTLPLVPTTNRAWTHQTTVTPSTDVGPTSGAGGSPDGYVYGEASSPGVQDDEFIMELDQTLNAATHDIEVQFKTNQRGNDNDALCQVVTDENGAGWVGRGTVFGGSGDTDKVATGGSDTWISRSVDLTGLISHASTRVGIRVTLNSAGNIWHCDYGLDEVVIIGTDQVAAEQEGHQFREDNGSESGADDIGAQDSNVSRAKETNTRLRVLSDMTGDAPTQAATLQYRKVGDAATEWRDVPE